MLRTLLSALVIPLQRRRALFTSIIILAPLLGSTLAFTMTPRESAALAPAHALQSGQVNPGDINQDGKVDTQDLLRLLQHLLGIDALTGNSLAAADANLDGSVNIQDLILIIQVLQGAAELPKKPTISAITPSEGTQGATVTVTITGANLDSVASVSFGSDITATIQSGGTAASITVQLSIGDEATVGARAFSVTTSRGTAESGSITFTVKKGAPVITGIIPSSGVQDSTVETAVISGKRLDGATAVSFSGSGVTAEILAGVTSTSLPIKITIAEDASPGARTFAVTTSGGTTQSGSVVFTVNQAAPAIAGISPSSGLRGSTVTVTITGSHLDNATSVTVSGSGVTAQIQSGGTASSLTVSITIAANASTTARTVTVTTPGGSVTGDTVLFTINQPPPTVTRIEPSSGRQGEVVNATITGSDLDNATSVVFSGANVVAEIQSGGTITSLPIKITIDSSATAGSRTITVVTPGGNVTTSTVAFQVLQRATTGVQITTTNPTVNKGSTLKLDVTGSPTSFTSDNTDVATVDATGLVTGRQAGFATITASDANSSSSVTVSVIDVESDSGSVSSSLGVGEGEVRVDLSGRIYQSDMANNVIRQGKFGESMQLYAGREGQPGYLNGPRESSLFNGPLGLAIDNREGYIYVADAANSVIRRMRPDGQVDAIAGVPNQTGSNDGSVSSARFNSPRGVAVDINGNLFVADSGNHTIRYIDVVAGQVKTIAGSAGSSGLVDGDGSVARFKNPQSLTLDTSQRSVIVTDTGNNVIRLIAPKSDGTGYTVTTLGAVGTIQTGAAMKGELEALPLEPVPAISFLKPRAANVDSLGNIYVVEEGLTTAQAGVKVYLRQTGEVVNLAQAGTFTRPTGVAIDPSGQVIVFDPGAAQGRTGLRRISYGPPVIEKVEPGEAPIQGGIRVIVTGKNFAPETLVLLDGIPVGSLKISNTTQLSFVTPPVSESGLRTLTVQHRGGLDQKSFFLKPPPLTQIGVGFITTVGGGSTFVGDGGGSFFSVLDIPIGMTIDSKGFLHIADSQNHRIRRIDFHTRTITTVVGTGGEGIAAEGTPASSARLNNPSDIVFDRMGNMYIADTDNDRVLKVDPVTQRISVFAGGGKEVPGDNGPARNAKLSKPFALAIDRQGNLLITEKAGHRIRRVDTTAENKITTVAGTGAPGFSGDNGRATSAQINTPLGITIAPNGDIVFVDNQNGRIRNINLNGIITTIAGTGRLSRLNPGTIVPRGDGGPATSAIIDFPTDIAYDHRGNLYIAEALSNPVIRRVDAATKVISTIVGGGTKPTTGIGDGGLAANAKLDFPSGILFDGQGGLFIADGNFEFIFTADASNRIRRVENPLKAAISDSVNVVIDPNSAVIFTIAGAGTNLGDGGVATAATLDRPEDVDIDPTGSIVVADSRNNRIRRIDSLTSIIRTLVGGGDPTIVTNIDSNDPSLVPLNGPSSVIIDGAGTVFIADQINRRIRRYDAATRKLTTIAGTGESPLPGVSEEGKPAKQARLGIVVDLALDREGNLYLVEMDMHRIRRIDKSGNITTVVGTGAPGFSGDGGRANAATINRPISIAFDRDGNGYIADHLNGRVRRVDARTGIITTVAGSGKVGALGDGDLAINVSLSPISVLVDGAGNIFLFDELSRRIRKIDALSGRISTVGGGGNPLKGLGDGGPATEAVMATVSGMAVDNAGNLVFSEGDLTGLTIATNRVRVIKGIAVPLGFRPGIGPQ